MGWFCVGLLVVCVTVTFIDAECHCNTTDACDVFPSTPCSQVGSPDRCQEGWFGSYCLKQNITLGRTCSQSSILNNDANKYRAGLAVDGRATTDARSTPLTCSHTKQETDPTWTVNLDTSRPEKIQHIRLYLRYDLQERNNGMEILVGNQMCFNWSSTEHPPPIANVTCRQLLTGTTVTVRIPGSQKFVTLCEVQIFACPDGSYGVNCITQCGNCVDGDICDKTNGTCPRGCAAGWINDTTCLQACPNGTYGINCSSPCGNCLDDDICDKTNGACPRGCASGWINDTTCLQACPDGSYGSNCESQCGNCLDGDICDKTKGTCPTGCAAGWQSDATCLNACPKGYHGSNCVSECGNCLEGVNCDKTNGTCPGGCAAGWESDDKMLCLQRPKPGTVTDFWRMVWQEDVTQIVHMDCQKPKSKQRLPR